MARHRPFNWLVEMPVSTLGGNSLMEVAQLGLLKHFSSQRALSRRDSGGRGEDAHPSFSSAGPPPPLSIWICHRVRGVNPVSTAGSSLSWTSPSSAKGARLTQVPQLAGAGSTCCGDRGMGEGGRGGLRDGSLLRARSGERGRAFPRACGSPGASATTTRCCAGANRGSLLTANPFLPARQCLRGEKGWALVAR